LAELTVACREVRRWSTGIAVQSNHAAGRRSVLTSLEAAAASIPDGAVVGIGGAVTAGHPMALVRALAHRGARDLTVVAPTGGIEIDLLIAAGCVRRVVGSYVGVEGLAAVGPVYRRAMEAGEVEMEDLDEAHCVMALRAAAQGLPFLPWRGGVGTSFPQLNPKLVEFDSPVGGDPLLAVPAIVLDVALLYAEAADEHGNAQVVGTGHMDNLLGQAAQRVIVQTDRVVSNEQIRAQPERTWYWPETSVVHAPFGTHPYANGWMTADEEHLAQFVAAGRAGGDELDAYLDRHVRGPATNEDYLETIGVRRLVSLLV
jgi:glutaconate CoA-transferase subunit A